MPQPYQSNYVDWTNFTTPATDEDTPVYYYSFTHNAYLVFDSSIPLPTGLDTPPANSADRPTLDCFRAIKDNVPKSFQKALVDPEWGEPARDEFNIIVQENSAIVCIDPDLAAQHIRDGAEVLYMHPVYEEKLKEGKVVRKVRLVINGRNHKKHGDTYAPTPSREEFLILLHIIATLDFDYWHLDEKRAFLSAEKTDKYVTLARIVGDPNFYQVLKALYGLKTSSHDYQQKVIARLAQLGFTRLHICSSIFYKYEQGKLCIVFAYVDDFIFTGNNNATTLSYIAEFRKLAQTTEPDLNASNLLGMEIVRDRPRRLISIRMTQRIADLAALFPQATQHKRNVPIPTSAYLVLDSDFESLSPSASTFLTPTDRTTYMQIVGSLIWIQVLRPDIIFAVLYLSWFTHKPRHHHILMAYYCIGYLHTTIDLPLVLGGTSPISLTGWTDASLGTGPRRRSVLGHITALGPDSGAIQAKATTSTSTCLSSFEAELDGLTTMLKTLMRLRHVLRELLPDFPTQGQIYSDNEALVNFINSDIPFAKGVRHVEMRQYFTRDTLLKGEYKLQHIKGTDIPADKLTKLGNVTEHQQFTRQILGLSLLDSTVAPEPSDPLPKLGSISPNLAQKFE
jgi:hypothetical protein